MKTEWTPALTLAKPSAMTFGGHNGQPRTWGWGATFCEGGRGFARVRAAKAAAREAVDKHLAAMLAIFDRRTIEIVRGDRPYSSSAKYNQNVIIDGEHRATFRPSGFSRGYHLRDLGDEGISFSDYERHGVNVLKRENFLEVIAVALHRNLIPTQAEVDARKAAYEARITARHEANAQAAADRCANGKMGEMLALLRSISPREPAALRFVEKLDAEAVEGLRSTLDRAPTLALSNFETEALARAIKTLA